MVAPKHTPTEAPLLYEGLADRLAATRKEAGLSYRELGERSGVNFTTINGIEKQKYSAGVGVVERLAIALEVSPAWLAYGLGAKRYKR